MTSFFYAIVGFFVLFFAPYEGAPPGYSMPYVILTWFTLPLLLPLIANIVLRRMETGRTPETFHKFLLIRRWLMILNLFILAVNIHLYGLLYFLRQSLPSLLCDASAVAVFIAQTSLLLLSISPTEMRLRDMRPLSKSSFVLFHTRQYAVAAIPFLIIDALITSIQHLPSLEEELVVFPSLLFLPLAGIVLIMFIFFPLGMRLLLPSKRLEDEGLRDALVILARRARVSIRDMFVWKTGNWRIANASISGILRGIRYVFITDAILGFPEDELSAVFAHELGHARMRHMTLYMSLAVSFIGLNLFLERMLSPLPSEVQLSAFLSIVVVYWVFLFGWVSRRFEQSADVFAAELVGTEPFIRALLRIFAYSGGTTRSFIHWRHFPISRRIETLQTLRRDPSSIKRITRSTRCAILILSLIVLLGLGGYMFVAFQDASTAEDVVFYKRALYAGYNGDYEYALSMAEKALQRKPDDRKYKRLVEELERLLKEGE